MHHPQSQRVARPRGEAHASIEPLGWVVAVNREPERKSAQRGLGDEEPQHGLTDAPALVLRRQDEQVQPVVVRVVLGPQPSEEGAALDDQPAALRGPGRRALGDKAVCPPAVAVPQRRLEGGALDLPGAGPILSAGGEELHPTEVTQTHAQEPTTAAAASLRYVGRP